MKSDIKESNVSDYVERWGILFEGMGSNRITGKIMGWLLICDPPRQTAGELAEAIGASIASISLATRTLIQMSMIERVGIPGKRSAYYRVREGVWTQMWKRRLPLIVSMRILAEEGLDLFDPVTTDSTERLRETMSYCAFWERELPLMMKKWEHEWKEQRNVLEE